MMEQQPIYNPIIPFTGSILGGLQDGKLIIIQGQVPGHAKRFAMDFMCGSCEKPRSDIAFHFNIRYDESTVVCNTLECERWGSEERKQQIPINAGTYFELIFKTEYYGFQVSVNGQHFLQYNHRLPLSRVDTLKISGDVHVNAITFKNPNVGSCLSSPNQVRNAGTTTALQSSPHPRWKFVCQSSQPATSQSGNTRNRKLDLQGSV